MTEVGIDALILAPVAMASILSWGAVGKLRLSPSARLDALAELGGPSALQRAWIVDLHPWVELLVAVLLVATPVPYAVGASLAALGLTVVYLGLVVAAHRRPERATCSCFGRSRAELSGRTVARNAVLVAIAAAALVDAAGGGGFVARIREQGGTGLLWIGGATVVAVLAALLVDPARDHAPDGADLVGERDGPIRVPVAADLELLDEHGLPRRVTELAGAAPQLLIFGSFGCSACSSIYRDFPHFAALLPGIAVRYVVTPRDGDPRTAPDEVPLWSDPDSVVARALGAAEQRPASVLVGVDGLTAGTAYGARDVRSHVGTLVVQLNQGFS